MDKVILEEITTPMKEKIDEENSAAPCLARSSYDEAQTLALEIHNLKKDLWDFQDTLKIQAEIIDAQKERLDSIETDYKRYLKNKNIFIQFIQNLFCGSRVKSNDEGNKSYSSQEPIRQRKADDVHEAEI